MTAYAPNYGPPADPTNVIGRRIGAWFIDLLIYLVLVVAAIVLSDSWEFNNVDVPGKSAGNAYCVEWNKTNDGACSYADGTVTTLVLDMGYVGGAFILNLLGYIVIQGATGGSLGKLAVGLRVVDGQGRKAGMGKSAIRTLLWAVDGIAFGFPVVGGVLMVSTGGHRRVGDMAANTYVVDKNQLGHPLAVPGSTTAWAGTPSGPPPADGYGQPGGYEQAPGTWPPTDPPGPFPTSPPLQAAPTPTGDGPTWDAARDAYIQYDREQSAWVQWDANSQQWLPIDQ